MLGQTARMMVASLADLCLSLSLLRGPCSLRALPAQHCRLKERALPLPAAVAAMAFAAGLCQGAAWAGPAYGLHLLQPPGVALERCWLDTDSLFAGLADLDAQVEAGDAEGRRRVKAADA